MIHRQLLINDTYDAVKVQQMTGGSYTYSIMTGFKLKIVGFLLRFICVVELEKV